MKNSDQNDSTTKKPCWSEVRERIASSGDQWRNVRSWTSRKKAAGKIQKLGKEFSVLCDRSKKIQVGDYGICRYRTAGLRYEPDQFLPHRKEIFFADLYMVREISADRAWMRIETSEGVCGWFETRNHFFISRGEYKILNSVGNSPLNFLVNALSAAR